MPIRTILSSRSSGHMSCPASASAEAARDAPDLLLHEQRDARQLSAMAAGHRSGPCRTRNYLSKVVIIEMRVPARGPEDREKKVQQVGFQPNLPRPGAPSMF